MPPQCDEYSDCQSCAGLEDCAWCASEGKCLTVSEIFGLQCRGTVFDLPCPVSYIGVNKVVGNMVVQPDPAFGGGEFVAYGAAEGTGNRYEFTISDSEAVLVSANDVDVKAGALELRLLCAKWRDSSVFRQSKRA